MTASEKNKKLGAELRGIREDLGMSRDVFAARLNISRTTLKNAENGQQKIGDRTLREARRMLADRQRQGGGLMVCEPSRPYSAESSDNSVVTREEIKRVIELSREERVADAASALVRAVGVSEEEALAMVIRERLRQD